MNVRAFLQYFATYKTSIVTVQVILESLFPALMAPLAVMIYHWFLFQSERMPYPSIVELLPVWWLCAILMIYLRFLVRAVFHGFSFHCYEVISRHFGYKGVRYNKDHQQYNEIYFKHWPKRKELIIASADMDDEGTMWAVMKPGRHHHVRDFMWDHDMNKRVVEQGFMTNQYRFIGREEARALAIANGQCLKPDHDRELFSEDLWDTPAEFTRLSYLRDKQDRENN